MWYTTTTSAWSGVTVTISFGSNSTNFCTVDVFGVSGADTTTPWDGAAVTGDTDPLTLSTTNANTFIIGGFRQSGTANPTAGSGYTLISGADFQLAEYKIVSSAQTNLSVTDGAAGDSNGAIAAAIVQASAAAACPATLALMGVGC